MKDDAYSFYNIRGQLTPKMAFHEMYGSQNPELECNFSSSLSSPPTWTMNFDEVYAVKSITLFNIKNGALQSNLDGSTLYVGDVECAKMGSRLPEN